MSVYELAVRTGEIFNGAPVDRTDMDASRIQALIEDALQPTHVDVGTRSDMPEDDHYEALVVSGEFEGKTLVEQHQLVYDALGDHMTRDIHALELTTYTPEEYADRME